MESICTTDRRLSNTEATSVTLKVAYAWTYSGVWCGRLALKRREQIASTHSPFQVRFALPLVQTANLGSAVS